MSLGLPVAAAERRARGAEDVHVLMPATPDPPEDPFDTRRGAGSAPAALPGGLCRPGRPPPRANACSSGAGCAWRASKPCGRHVHPCCWQPRAVGRQPFCFADSPPSAHCARLLLRYPGCAGCRWRRGVPVPLVLRTGGDPRGPPGASVRLGGACAAAATSAATSPCTAGLAELRCLPATCGLPARLVLGILTPPH